MEFQQYLVKILLLKKIRKGLCLNMWFALKLKFHECQNIFKLNFYNFKFQCQIEIENKGSYCNFLNKLIANNFIICNWERGQRRLDGSQEGYTTIECEQKC